MNAAARPGRWGVIAGLLLVAVAMAAAAVAGWRRAYELDRDLARTRSEHENALADLKQAQAEVRVVEALRAEVERLQRETKDLHALRAQYQEWQRLKAEHEQLEKQNAALKQSQQVLSQAVQEAKRSSPRPRPVSWVGIAMDTTYQDGVKVQSVAPGSPAAQVDIAADDLILAVDGRQVTNPAELQNVIAGKRVGETLTLSLQRGGQLRSAVLRTAAFPR